MAPGEKKQSFALKYWFDKTYNKFCGPVKPFHSLDHPGFWVTGKIH